MQYFSSYPKMLVILRMNSELAMVLDQSSLKHFARGEIHERKMRMQPSSKAS